MARVPPSRPRFARAQALADLRAFAGLAGAEPWSAIAAGVPGVSSEAVAEAARTGRIDRHGAALREAVALAAAVPGETEAFRLATALLLAEALRGGAADGLGWYLDAHADAYRHAPAPVRAAILNGYRVLHALDLGGIGHLPAPEARATRSQAEVEAGMAGVSPNVLKRLLRALDGGPAAETEALWRERAADLIAAPPVADAMRHLYETRDDWDPWRDWPEERIAREGVVIPFEAP
jgi:hypothetical protein